MREKLKMDIKRSVMLALIIAVFISVLVSCSTDGENIHNKHLVYAENRDEVDAYIYQKTPGLKRAEREGNVFNLDKRVKIPQGKGTLEIYKVWYSSENIYVFYSIEGAIPTDADAGLKWRDGISTTNHLENMNIGEGIVYNDTYYSRLTFYNFKYDKEKPDQEVQRKLALEIYLTYGELGKNEEKIRLPQIDIDVTFDPAKETVYRLPLAGEVSLGDYGRLLFHELILEPQESYLLYDYINDHNNRMYCLAGRVKVEGEDEEKLWIPVGPTGKISPFYRLKFTALDSVPDRLEINISGVKLVTAEEISFEIPVERFRGKMKDPGEEDILNEKIGFVKDVGLYLSRLYWDGRGLFFEIRYDIEGSDNPVDRISGPTPRTFREVMHAKEKEAYKSWRFPNVIRVENEKGVEAGFDDFGSRGVGPGETINMNIKKEFIEKSNKIKVTLYNPTYRAVGSWKGIVKIKESVRDENR